MGFQQGVSGLISSAKALDVTGNNIANSATVGFKSSRTNFADVYAASMLAGGSGQAGIGTTVSAVQQQFTQGTRTTTTNALDLAISGGGFYKLAGLEDNIGTLSGGQTYTRNGQFHLNKDGFVVNDQGLALIGVQANKSTGDIPQNIRDTDLGAINVTASVGQPKASTTTMIQANLKSTDVPATAPNTFNIAQPETFQYSNFSRGMDVYDSQGNSHSLDFYFVKTANTNEWQLYTTMSDVYTETAVAPQIPGQPLSTVDAAGNSIEDVVASSTNPITMVFRTDGILDTVTDSAGNVYTYNPTATPPNFLDAGGNQVTIETVSNALHQDFDGSAKNGTLGTKVDTISVALDVTNLTQFSSGYSVDKMTQDGYPKGKLAGLNVDEYGVVSAQYDNGKSSAVGRVVLYSFANPNGLANLGNNQWSETALSGRESYNFAGVGNAGTIQSYAVEESNVDLTQELVNLIVQQRNYQANAQTIKTQDQVMQTLVNMR